MIEIRDCRMAEEDAVVSFAWQVEGDVIDGLLTSGSSGVVLRFGPTVAVAHWPAWLRAISHVGEAGGEATIWLDPHREPADEVRCFRALDMRGAQARRALALLLQALGDALAGADREADVGSERRQAAETCRGTALALTAEQQAMVPQPAEYPDLFWPSPIPIVVDDHDRGPDRQHVRLKYLLPRIECWLTAGCSLRLFRSADSFGVEFRSLSGDHLPPAIREACMEDGLGPLLRFTFARDGSGTRFEGEAQDEGALRVVEAIVRQVSHDLTAQSALASLAGFAGEVWRHWLAALPDLLASALPMPLETAQDIQGAH